MDEKGIPVNLKQIKKFMECAKRDRLHGTVGTSSKYTGIRQGHPCQGPLGLESSKGYQGQQAQLLQVHQRQREE